MWPALYAREQTRPRPTRAPQTQFAPPRCACAQRPAAVEPIAASGPARPYTFTALSSGIHRTRETERDRVAETLLRRPRMHAAARLVEQQLASIRLGQGHGKAGLGPVSRCAIIASSLAYLCCSLQWHLTGFPMLAGLFCLVAGLSSLADGCSDLLPSRLLPLARRADRTAGTAGLVASIWHNCTTAALTILCAAAAACALWLLLRARRAALARPHAQREWVAWQSAWHIFGAAALCGLIELAHH